VFFEVVDLLFVADLVVGLVVALGAGLLSESNLPHINFVGSFINGAQTYVVLPSTRFSPLVMQGSPAFIEANEVFGVARAAAINSSNKR
jgi:hypothetical protein